MFKNLIAHSGFSVVLYLISDRRGTIGKWLNTDHQNTQDTTGPDCFSSRYLSALMMSLFPQRVSVRMQ